MIHKAESRFKRREGGRKGRREGGRQAGKLFFGGEGMISKTMFQNQGSESGLAPSSSFVQICRPGPPQMR